VPAKTIRFISGKSVRLTEERWRHIKERHPEVSTHKQKVLETISSPDAITRGWTDELIAIRKFANQDLAVIYKEEANEGFIITAFFTRSREYFKKRGIIWNKH
jgi:hypothetical protein